MKLTRNEILVSNENTKSGIKMDHIGGNGANPLFSLLKRTQNNNDKNI